MTILDKLRAAQGPDRELGREVLLACGWRKTCVGHFYGPLYHWSGPNGEHFKDDDFARHDPTASVDAAMTLVSEGWIWDVTSTGTAWTMPDGLDGELHFPGKGATPAIALCIAALLSRGIE